MANFLKGGEGVSRSLDEGMQMARPLTPKSERRRSSYGSLSMSLQSLEGRCKERKCVRKENHEGDCWPK